MRQVFHVMRRMDEEGCDLFLDIHGDEEIAANFLAGSEGIPSYNEPMAALAKTFMTGCETLTPSIGLFCLVQATACPCAHTCVPGYMALAAAAGGSFCAAASSKGMAQ